MAAPSDGNEYSGPSSFAQGEQREHKEPRMGGFSSCHSILSLPSAWSGPHHRAAGTRAGPSSAVESTLAAYVLCPVLLYPCQCPRMEVGMRVRGGCACQLGFLSLASMHIPRVSTGAASG